VSGVFLAVVSVVLTFSVGAAAAPTDEALTTGPVAVEPALALHPRVTAILDGLGDNASAALPPIKTVGEWNEVSKRYRMHVTGPVGRDFCVKAVWAPERKRALYCGANHGSPHRLNDVWEYDLPSNTWVMLFAPDPNKPRGEWEAWAKEVATVKDGVIQTKRGGPLDPWHTWWQITYVPEMKALIWGNPQSVHSKIPAILKIDEATLYRGHPFWLFYPAEKKWQPLKTAPPYPVKKIGGAQSMAYIPDLGGPVYYASNWFAQGMWAYSPKTNSWKDLKPNGGQDMYHNKTTPRSEAIMAYDTANKVLVAVNGTVTYQYDLATNAWSKAVDKPKDSTDVPTGHDARTPFGYDPAGQVCVLYDPRTPDSVWTYSVPEKVWTRHTLTGPPGPNGRLIGYYDLARSVMVVWVCRYQQPGAKALRAHDD